MNKENLQLITPYSVVVCSLCLWVWLLWLWLWLWLLWGLVVMWLGYCGCGYGCHTASRCHCHTDKFFSSFSHTAKNTTMWWYLPFTVTDVMLQVDPSGTEKSSAISIFWSVSSVFTRIVEYSQLSPSTINHKKVFKQEKWIQCAEGELETRKEERVMQIYKKKWLTCFHKQIHSSHK